MFELHLMICERYFDTQGERIDFALIAKIAFLLGALMTCLTAGIVF